MPELTPEQQRIIEQAKQRAKNPLQQGAQQTTQLSQQQAAILSKYQPQPQAQRSAVDQALLSIPGARPAMEMGNAMARAVVGAADYIGPELINNALTVAGSSRQVPTFTGALESVGALAPVGSYMEPGIGRDIATAAGQAVPAAVTAQYGLREAVRRIPAAVDQVKSTGRRVVESLARPTPRQEATAAAGAVAGAEIGEETGIPGAGVVGAIVGGAGALPLIGGADRLFTNSADLATTASNLSNLNTDIAAEMLARSLRASGMSVREAVDQYRALGPNALPADINDPFREVLRAAMNIDEGIAGEARRAVNLRQTGAGQRISKALDIIDADSLDDYLNRIDQTLRPEINRLYEQAAANPVAISGRLRAIMEGDNSLGRARQTAEARLADRRAAGDKISHFDIIDETKRVLDDQIGSALRDGRRNEVRNLTRLRNMMMQEADAQVPGYAEARATYAGRAALDDAAKIGSQFYNTSSRELVELTKSMTAQEKTAYALAAKDAIMNRIENTGMNRNQVQALFGKNGDAAKLRSLFDNQSAFDTFQRSLRQETEYAITRQAAIGNSTTAAQLRRMQQTLNPPGGYRRVIGQAAAVLSGGPQAIAREVADIGDNLKAGQGSEQYINGLIRAGDILITAGIDPARVEAIIRRGNSALIETELRRIAEPSFARRGAVVTGTAASQTTEDNQ